MSGAIPIVVAGATGDLGGRIAVALGERGLAFRALIRSGTSAEAHARLRATGATLAEVDYADPGALRRACVGASCVVSALNGLEPVMIGMQGRLLDAAVAEGVARFVPSDFSLDFTRTTPGNNRNLDLRRRFMEMAGGRPIRTTSVLNGGFADLLTGQAPLVLPKLGRVVYWGDPDQMLDFTDRDDVARYTVDVALDEAAPDILRIAGSSVSARQLADLMTTLSGRRFRLFRGGDISRLSRIIAVVRRLTPQSGKVFPVWQGMQYLRDMMSGRGQLSPLDNDRYGARGWTTARDVLARLHG